MTATDTWALVLGALSLMFSLQVSDDWKRRLTVLYGSLSLVYSITALILVIVGRSSVASTSRGVAVGVCGLLVLWAFVVVMVALAHTDKRLKWMPQYPSEPVGDDVSPGRGK